MTLHGFTQPGQDIEQAFQIPPATRGPGLIDGEGLPALPPGISAQLCKELAAG